MQMLNGFCESLVDVEQMKEGRPEVGIEVEASSGEVFGGKVGARARGGPRKGRVRQTSETRSDRRAL